MIESAQSKRLLALLREARKREPREDVRLVAMMGGVLFSRKSDREQANHMAAPSSWGAVDNPDVFRALEGKK